MRTHSFLTFASVLAITIMGCATIIDGTNQSVTFNSDPSGAEIVIHGVTKGVTPLTLLLKREGGVVALAKKEGYQDQQVPLSTRTNGWIAANIIWGLLGILSTSTDMGNGAAYEYDPDSYYITLTPSNASEQQQSLLHKKMWARNFVLGGYWHIAADIAKGEGEYVSSVYEILGFQALDREESLQRLREMFLRHQDIPSFAEAVVDYSLLNSGS